jgi:hypothetical protein
MKKFLSNNPVNSENPQTDNAVGNSDPSPYTGKEQRLSRKRVGSSDPKRRRPSRGVWFDGEVCQICKTTDRKHHAKGLCKRCYQTQWYEYNPTAKSKHDSDYYLKHTDEIAIKSKAYYLENSEIIKNRVLSFYREKGFDGNMLVALERDQFSCRNIFCPKSCDRLDVHHIDGRGINHPNPNHALKNLLTLCASCHSKLHAGRDIVWARSKDLAVYNERHIIVLIDGYRSSELCRT